MKSLFIAALLFATANVNAAEVENLFVTAQLTKNGEVIHKFAGGGGNGVQQHFRDVEDLKFRESMSETGKTPKVHIGHQDIGYKLDVTPRISSSGDVSVKLNSSLIELVDMPSETVNGLTIDVPHVLKNSFESTHIIKSGEALDIPVTAGATKYVLTVTATRHAQ